MARIKLISLCFIFLHLANSCCGTELNIDSNKLKNWMLSVNKEIKSLKAKTNSIEEDVNKIKTEKSNIKQEESNDSYEVEAKSPVSGSYYSESISSRGSSISSSGIMSKKDREALDKGMKDFGKAMFMAMETNNNKSDDENKQKFCFTDQETIVRAVMMYNTDHTDSPMKSLDTKLLESGNYFQMACAFGLIETGCHYSMDENMIVNCEEHGSVIKKGSAKDNCFLYQSFLFLVKNKKAYQNGGQLNLTTTNYDDFLKEMNVKEVPSWVDKGCKYITNGDLSKNGYIECKTHGFALEEDFKKSCFANQRIIAGAVDFYNMENEKNPMTSLNIEELLKNRFIRKKPEGPNEKCEYYIEDNEIKCKYHGSGKSKIGF